MSKLILKSSGDFPEKGRVNALQLRLREAMGFLISNRFIHWKQGVEY